MKLRTLASQDLKVAMSKLLAMQLPIQVAFKVKRLVISINAELNKYDEMRKSYLEELGRRDEAGKLITDKEGNVEFGEGNKDEFFRRDNKLLDMEILLHPIKVSELGNIALSPSDLFALEEVLKE